MIIDSNLVFSDKQKITVTASSKAVGLTSFSHPGQMDPLPVLVRVLEAFNNCTSISLELHQSATEAGTYAPVAGSACTVKLDELKKEGQSIGWRFVPSFTAPWLKITYTVTGTAPTQGAVFAAIVREDSLPYADGMYIDAGLVKG